MKIVFVIPSLKTGGGNRVFVELANQLCKNHIVHIVAPNNSSDKHTFEMDNHILINVIGQLATSKLSKILNLFKTIKYLNRNHKSAVIISTDPLFSLSLFFIKSTNLYRFIQADDYRIFDDGSVLGHGILLNIYKALCLNSYNYKGVKFIFNSRFVYQQFCECSKRYGVPYLLVHPAINHDIFNSVYKEPINGDNLSICLVARKHPMKGIVTFINVLKGLEPVCHSKISKVVMVSHDDLSAFDADGITIVKPKSDKDIADAYRSADIFISTSWWEGFGLPPLEAMACGCAVICSDSGGVNEYVRSNENCLMFEPKNETELNECIVRLIEDVRLRVKISNEGRETSNNFTWEKSAQQLEQILM